MFGRDNSASPPCLHEGELVVRSNKLWLTTYHEQVHADHPEAVCSVLKAGDDPHSRAKRIETLWRVDHRINTGSRRADNTNARSSHLVLRCGDFVDVAVAINIVTYRKKGKLCTEILFAPQDVLRLWTADQAKVSCSALQRLIRCTECMYSSFIHPKATVIFNMLYLLMEHCQDLALTKARRLCIW